MTPDLKTVIKIIPTYNEIDNIGVLAKRSFELNPDISMLVVDDNSPDGTADLVASLASNNPNLTVFKRLKDRGFGRSYLEGFKQVLHDNRYNSVVMMDADFSHDPVEIKSMVSQLADFDVVIGSRYIKGGAIQNWPFKRLLLSKFANLYVRTILGVPILDMTTGYICLRKSVLEKIDLASIHSDGYSFLVELKYRLYKAGFKIVEHPIIFSERREGQSKMSSKVIFESIWMPFKLKWKK